jgi:dienelactone hydrolase
MRRGLVLCLVLLCAGCGGSSSPPRHAALRIAPRSALIDAPVSVTVSGLRAGDRVRVSAAAPDYRGTRYTATASARADGRGAARIQGGDMLAELHGADGQYLPRFGTTTFNVIAEVDGHRAAAGTLTRATDGAGVHARRLTVRRDGLAGDFFMRPGDHGAPVVAIGGSNGNQPEYEAQLLASHGHPALALDYFGGPGLPSTLRRIPLEYFERALRWVARRTGVSRVALYGVSRGGEGGLIVASRYPSLVSGVVALVPSAIIGLALDDPHAPAWTLGGRPLAGGMPIAVERIRGPVLTSSGGRDKVWPSADYTRQIHARLRAHHFGYAHPDLRYPAAGHGVASPPYLPGIPQSESGGTPAADAAARAALWPKVLRFFDGL